MLKANIVLEKYLKQSSSINQAGFKAATNIKELLAQIDSSAEVVPENNLDMFSRLICSLKNEELTIEEKMIIKEIVQL